jgi:hypothetical protein
LDAPLCQHRDIDDNGVCDKCEQAYADGKDSPTCQHRDADDDTICDYCYADYTDGKDIPDCQHRDADDNNECDLYRIRLTRTKVLCVRRNRKIRDRGTWTRLE